MMCQPYGRLHEAPTVWPFFSLSSAAWNSGT